MISLPLALTGTGLLSAWLRWEMEVASALATLRRQKMFPELQLDPLGFLPMGSRWLSFWTTITIKYRVKNIENVRSSSAGPGQTYQAWVFPRNTASLFGWETFVVISQPGQGGTVFFCYHGPCWGDHGLLKLVLCWGCNLEGSIGFQMLWGTSTLVHRWREMAPSHSWWLNTPSGQRIETTPFKEGGHGGEKPQHSQLWDNYFLHTPSISESMVVITGLPAWKFLELTLT